MKTIYSDIKSYYFSLPSVKRIQIVIIVTLFFFIAVSTLFIIQASKKCFNDNPTITDLKKQNEALIKNNKELISTVQGLNNSLKLANKEDSLRNILIEENNSFIPKINSKLSKLNNSYEQISRIRNYSSADIQRYFADESKSSK